MGRRKIKNEDLRAIEVIKTSERGALLITDGVHVAWVMGRTKRADGTFTASAYSALDKGKDKEQWEKEQYEREHYKEIGQQPYDLIISKEDIQDYSEKAWKVYSGHKRPFMGKMVRAYNYIPKSMVTIKEDGEFVVITMPTWYRRKNSWLEKIEVVPNPETDMPENNEN